MLVIHFSQTSILPKIPLTPKPIGNYLYPFYLQNLLILTFFSLLTGDQSDEVACNLLQDEYAPNQWVC